MLAALVSRKEPAAFAKTEIITFKFFFNHLSDGLPSIRHYEKKKL